MTNFIRYHNLLLRYILLVLVVASVIGCSNGTIVYNNESNNFIDSEEDIKVTVNNELTSETENETMESVEITSIEIESESKIESEIRIDETNTLLNDNESMEVANMSTYFVHKKISTDIKSRILGISYPKNATIPLSDLRYIEVLYYGFDEETHIGELIVNKAVADDIIDIFKELYDAKYPIEKINLIDEYDANDDLSMEDNNSSAFNYRTIAGTNRLSKHSMGIAIDINPLYNPYITTIKGVETILPSNAKDYVDRSRDFPYKIVKDDICYNAFIKRGWTWGGEWVNSKDYQHFEKKIN